MTELMTPPADTHDRVPVRLVIAMLAVVLGISALVAGYMYDSAPAISAPRVPDDAVKAGDIAIYGAYMREPVTDTAAAYFTMTNTGSKPDVLVSLSTPVAESTVMHDVGKTLPTAGSPSDLGSSSMTPTPEVAIAPGQTVTLRPGEGHVMLEKLSGTIAPGSTINLHLTFQDAGTVSIKVPVIALTDPAPTS